MTVLPGSKFRVKSREALIIQPSLKEPLLGKHDAQIIAHLQIWTFYTFCTRFFPQFYILLIFFFYFKKIFFVFFR